MKPLTLHRVSLRTGITMHYAAKNPGAARSAERALVLLHGYSDSWRTFEEMLALLPFSEHALPVFALDARGHGGSSLAPDGTYTLPALAADVVAFLDAQGIERAILVGHSMGGLVAHQVAVDAPDRVEGLVLLATAASVVGQPALAELQDAVETFPDDGPAPVEFVREFQASTFYKLPEPHVLYRYVSESLRLPGTVWKALAGSMNTEDHRDRLPRVTAPTLVLWGEEDAVFLREAQEELVALLPHAQLITFPHTGHGINVERAAEVVVALRDFVAQRVSSERLAHR